MILVYILIFVFGACLASFLNCVVLRMEKGKSFAKGRPRRSRLLATLRGRSICPKCRHQLAWHDLIPVLSFLFLRGKCRYCHKKISIQYLLVEIAVGLLFILNFKFLICQELLTSFAVIPAELRNQILILNFKFLITVVYLIVINSLLILIFLYDLRNYIIPDRIVFPTVGLALIYQLFFGYSSLTFLGLSVAVSAGFFFLIWAISKGRWMGFGDVKLALFMGLFLSWPNILVALFCAFILGSIVGLSLIGLKKKQLQSQVPFGPFLIIGTFVALFWGRGIINIYLSFIL